MRERWTEKIKAGNLLDRLQKHAEGEAEMSQTQINAARVCLAKVLPDLKSVEGMHTVTHQELTFEDKRQKAQNSLDKLPEHLKEKAQDLMNLLH